MRLVSSIVAVLGALLVAVEPAFAYAGEAAASTGEAISAESFAIIGIAIAAVGGAMSQSKAISSALESIGRNPGAAGQMFLPWLLALVFIESLVIYALVIALKIVGLI